MYKIKTVHFQYQTKHPQNCYLICINVLENFGKTLEYRSFSKYLQLLLLKYHTQINNLL